MYSVKWLCLIFIIYTVDALANKDVKGHSVLKRNVLHSGYQSLRLLLAKPKEIKSPSDNPPDHSDYVAMARYVMHKTDWTSLATLSRIPKILGYPFTSVVSMSDGTVEKSVGIPYFYLTPRDFPAIDIAKDNRCSISVSLEQTGYCRSQTLVPDDPRCARVMLTGNVVKVEEGTAEYDFAKEALFSRHESMKYLPKDHGFYVAKMKIIQIVMLDWFGGPIYIALNDYLSYNGTTLYEKNSPENFSYRINF